MEKICDKILTYLNKVKKFQIRISQLKTHNLTLIKMKIRLKIRKTKNKNKIQAHWN